MAKLIDFNNYRQPELSRKKLTEDSVSNNVNFTPSEREEVNLFTLTLNVLTTSHSGKTIFSLKEAGEQLSVGEEFLRRRIKSGKIKATYLGDKPFINIVELARISTEGV